MTIKWFSYFIPAAANRISSRLQLVQLGTACQHSCHKISAMMDHVKISSHLAWSPASWKIWSMFLVLRPRMHEVPKILGTVRPRPLGWGRGWSLKNTLLPHVTIPNLVALGLTVWAYIGVPKICVCRGPALWDRGIGWPCRNTSLPTCVILLIITEIRKNLTPRVPPFKFIGTGTDLSSTISEINGENCNFSHHGILNTSFNEFPIGIL